MYTKEMIARMQAQAPLNFAKAEALASEFGVSARSVISKARTENIEYVKASGSKAAPRVRKADLVAQIEQALKAQGELSSLERASTETLHRLAFLVS
jgi:hypothetical protein